jgi:NADH:ubiquinone reductase (H+-translocating)
MPNPKDKKTIVILGAGFGGLRAAILLGKKIKKLHLTDKYRVLIIDQNDYHTYTPTLYEIATTSKEIANQFQLKEIVTFPIQALLWGTPVEFLKARVESIKPEDATITCNTGEVINYSHLVIALGSEPNFFNISGLQEYALTLKSFNDALHIRERIATFILEHDGKAPLSIVVGGGGSTGVEFAAELQTWLCEVTGLTPKVCWARTTIVEGGPTILGPFDKKIIEKAEKRLAALSINVMTNERISSVTKNEVMLASGKKLSADVLVWTGGVKPNSLIASLAIKLDEKSGRVDVTAEMECLPISADLQFSNKIYGIGDATCFVDPTTQRPVPGVARVALMQADIVSKNIIEEIKFSEKISTEKHLTKFEPRQYPYVIPVGGKYAIAKFGSVIISGFFGWILKGLVELNYLLSIMPKIHAFKFWIKGLNIFIKNDRLG